MSKLPPAGFYYDPDDPSRERWWDGAAWGGWTRTSAGQENEAPVERADGLKAQQYHYGAVGDAAASEEISHVRRVLSDPERRLTRYERSGDVRSEQAPNSFSDAEGAPAEVSDWDRMGVIIPLLALAYGFRFSYRIGGYSQAGCLGSQRSYNAACGSLVNDVIAIASANPGRTLLSAAILLGSAVPITLWLRASPMHELIQTSRLVIGYFSAWMSALFGAFFVAEWYVDGSSLGTLAAGIGLWVLGFGVTRVAFKKSRAAQIMYLVFAVGAAVLTAST